MGFLNDNFIADFFKIALNWVFGFIGEYSVAVILVALFVRLILMPFDLRQRKSSRKMALLAPEVESIRKRYANNPNQVNARIQLLYKENGVSSTAGCLPMILQLVFLLAFYGALKSIAAKETMSIILRAAENGGSSVELTRWLWVNNLWQPDSGFAGVLPSAKEFLSFLQSNTNSITPQTMQLLQNKGLILFNEGILSVNVSAYETLTTSVITGNGLTGFANGWFGLPVFTAGTTFLQQWLASKRNTNPAADMAGMNSGMMMYLYPIISLIFCTTSNAMFSIYWAFTNVYGIVVDIVYNRIQKKKEEAAIKQVT
ncbi:MAG: YidC/Oxa1 family membrane protein insertase [Christensenellaceae bacterium]|jgi:YidC/Oxa1 family membrane protein insertase